MFFLLFVALVVFGIGGGVIGINRKELRRLEGSGAGATHVTQVRRGTVRLTIGQYRRAGWVPVEQERLRTPGNKHLVAMTFRKV